MEPQARCRNNSSPKSCGRVHTLVWRKKVKDRDGGMRKTETNILICVKSIIASLGAKLYCSCFSFSYSFEAALLQDFYTIIIFTELRNDRKTQRVASKKCAFSGWSELHESVLSSSTVDINKNK